MMRHGLMIGGLGILVGLAQAQHAPAQSGGPVEAPQPQVQLTTLKDKVSYTIGLTIGRDLRDSGLDVDKALIIKGMDDALAGAEPLLTDEQCQAAMFQMQKQREMEQAQQQMATDPQIKAVAEANKAQGEAFLRANGQKEGVVTLPSGVQYKVIEQGDGPSPGLTDTVRTHYRGTLIDGTQFDSSYDRDEPAVFPVNRVIAGWTEALQLMKVGDKWQVFVPSDLAYGLLGRGEKIGPNATLIFEIELLDIE